MTWEHPAVKGPADLAVAHHQLLAGLEVEAVPVVLRPSGAWTWDRSRRPTCPRGAVGGRARAWRILFGDPGGVLGDLGQRDVGGHRDRTRRLDLGLERPEAPEVKTGPREAEVGLCGRARRPSRPGTPSARADVTAWRTTSASKPAGGPTGTWQKRWSAAWPFEGTKPGGSGVTQRVCGTRAPASPRSTASSRTRDRARRRAPGGTRWCSWNSVGPIGPPGGRLCLVVVHAAGHSAAGVLFGLVHNDRLGGRQTATVVCDDCHDQIHGQPATPLTH